MRHPSVAWMSRTLPTIMAALLAAIGGMAQAEAEPGPLTLTWDAPAGCPTAHEVLTDVKRTLAEPGGPLVPVTATVRVLALEDGMWQASLALDVRGARTERRFRAESCAAIGAATAVILAIAVQDALEAAPTPGTASATRDGETPGTARASPAGGQAARFFVTANGLVDWDTMPSPLAIGYEAAVGWVWGADRWRLSWVAGTDFFPSHPPPDTPYIGVVNGAFWSLGVSGRGCLGLALSRLEIGPCLGAELVAMHASDAGDVNAALPSLAAETQYWLSLLGSMAASWTVSLAMDVVLRADLAIPLQRRVFGLENNVLDDYQVPAHAVRGALGIRVRFP